MIYELLGIASSDDPELELRTEDRRLSDMTWIASDCFERGDAAGAARHYREILARFPNDPVASVMLRDLATA
jgi:adenylate cyclase